MQMVELSKLSTVANISKTFPEGFIRINSPQHDSLKMALISIFGENTTVR